jgi:hypothetical protein
VARRTDKYDTQVAIIAVGGVEVSHDVDGAEAPAREDNHDHDDGDEAPAHVDDNHEAQPRWWRCLNNYDGSDRPVECEGFVCKCTPVDNASTDKTAPATTTRYSDHYTCSCERVEAAADDQPTHDGV